MAVAPMVTRTSSHVSTPKKVEHGVVVGSRPPAYSAAGVVDSAVVTPPRGAMNVTASMVNDSSCNSANMIGGKKKHQFSILSKSLRKAFQKGNSSGGSTSADSTSPSHKANPDGSTQQQTPLTSPGPSKKTTKSSIHKGNFKPSTENPSKSKGNSDGVDVAVVTPPPPTYMHKRRTYSFRYSADGFCRQVDAYDGQIISVEGKEEYELGNFLGGGVAGVVYEALRLSSNTSSNTPSYSQGLFSPPPPDELQVAMKILNPLNFRLLPPSSLIEGENNLIVLEKGSMPESSQSLQHEHVWWIIHPNSRNLRNLKANNGHYNSSDTNTVSHNSVTSETGSKIVSTAAIDRGSPDRGLKLSVIACYWDHRIGQLRELPLKKCIEMWGMVPFSCSEEDFEKRIDEVEKLTTSFIKKDSNMDLSSQNNTVLASLALANTKKVVYCEPVSAFICIPLVPPKYLRWLRQRRAATKEIRNMKRIGRHKNVVHLHEVLELIQDTKSTMFLVLELVRGGELFDLISSQKEKNIKKDDVEDVVEGDPNVSWGGESQMREFFSELVSGIAYCHANGIAHRDLKPENLLVHTGPNGEKTLKIADFGLSATFALASSNNAHDSTGSNDVPGCSGAILGTWLQSPIHRFRNSHKEAQAPLPTTSQELNLSYCGHSTASPQSKTGSSSSSMAFSTFFTSPARLAMALLTCGEIGGSAYNNIIDETNLTKTPSPLHRMTSVVGSPHYVAPEIVSQATTEDEEDFSRASMQSTRAKKNGNTHRRKSSDDVAKVGYDGTKADVWSAGVILYAMLFRSLPFGEDLFRCPRFIAFNKWYQEARATTNSRRANGLASLDPFYSEEDENMLGPPWFFPQKTSRQSRDLIVAMLNPDPVERLSIDMVSKHPWLRSTPIQLIQGG